MTRLLRPVAALLLVAHMVVASAAGIITQSGPRLFGWEAQCVGYNATYGCPVGGDEFNGSGAVDPAKWNHETGFVRNAEAQCFTSDTENSFQDGGSLHIVAIKEVVADCEDGDPAQYTSASLRSQGLMEFTYGRLEIRAKVSDGRGIWPAFWTMGNAGDWPARGEIDIMEAVGFEDTVVHSNVHTTSGSSAVATTTVATMSSAWHIYAMDWDLVSLRFYIDDTLVGTYTNAETGTAQYPFVIPNYLLIGQAVGGSYGGMMGIDDAIFPVTFEVDYVRYWEAP